MMFTSINNLNLSKITLGTAQLGMNYGVANFLGKPSKSLSNQILIQALTMGINSFDTAPTYGDSETILGNFIKTNKKIPIITTKIPSLPKNINSSYEEIHEFVRNSILQSISSLNLNKLSICLLHNSSDIKRSNGLVVKSLIKLKDEGLVDHIGCSIYDVNDAKQLLKIKEFDSVQIPFNLFNFSLYSSGLLDKFADNNMIIFARSIFLQGLFFLKSDQLPTNLEYIRPYMLNLEKISKKFNLSIPELAFKFVNSFSQISSIIMGLESENQLLQNLSLLNSKPLEQNIKKLILDTFYELPKNVYNPNNWKI